jgi:hypothetical protein
LVDVAFGGWAFIGNPFDGWDWYYYVGIANWW